MLELAAIGAFGTLLKSVVVAAVNPASFAEGIAGNRADSGLVAGWRLAGHAIGCLRKNWTRLEPQENHILYRAMLLAHWRAVQQSAQQHGRHRGIDLKSVADALPLPVALKKALADSRNATSGLGLFSLSDQEALRNLVTVCDNRIAETEKGGALELPTQWASLLDTTYNDITALVQQGQRPSQGPAEHAWTALAAEFPQASTSPGFQQFFLEYWFDFFSVSFQFLTRDPTVAPLLTGKLFHEIKEREDSRALDPQKLLESLASSVIAVRGDIAELRQEQQQNFAEVKSLIIESLQQTRLAEPEPFPGLRNTHIRILSRDVEAHLLVEALRQPGPRVISIVAPPGFGKSGPLIRR